MPPQIEEQFSLDVTAGRLPRDHGRRAGQSIEEICRRLPTVEDFGSVFDSSEPLLTQLSQ